MSGPKQASVLDQLGLQIADGALRPGEVIRIDDLETRYACSRTIAREALKVIESIGMVTTRRRVGITIQAREHWNVFDPNVIRWRLAGSDRVHQLLSLTQLRAGIEPAAAALAAHHSTPEQCGTLTQAVIDMAVHARAGDLTAYLRADVLFHRTLLIASGNEMFAALADVVEEVLTGRTKHGLMPATPEHVAVRLHGDVAEAVRNQESADAHTHMQSILDETRQALT